MKNNFVAILVTCSSRKEATRIVDALLRKRLVACGNVIAGVESKFWWKGKIDKAREVIVILKTVRANFGKAAKEVKRLHSYEVPEIIAIPIIAGSEEYLEWVKGNMK